VSLLRPARKVSGPNGDYWELYASKTRLPTWRDAAIHVSRSGDPIFDIPIVVFSVLWGLLVAPLLFVLVLLPLAVVRGRRSRAIRIEAVRTFPDREVLLWTTTDGSVDVVLDEIAAGLAAGKVVQPEGAVYSGREEE
jgi:hypothetical protein